MSPTVLVHPHYNISATSSSTTLASARTDASSSTAVANSQRCCSGKGAMSASTSPIRGRKAASAPGTGSTGHHSKTTTPTKSPRRHLDGLQINQALSAAFASVSSISSSATSILSPAPTSVPPSSSSHNSPVLSPDAVPFANGSSGSDAASPEPFRGREPESTGSCSPFQLPEAMLSHKLSATSLQQCGPLPSPARPQPGAAMHEAMKQNTNLIRRLSNKASKAITRRRPSSVHPNSRDVSVGPGILRRRSDSNNTAPTCSDLIEPVSGFDTESEAEADLDERDDGESIATSAYDNTGLSDSSPTTNTASSINGSIFPPLVTATHVGPVIPMTLLHGISICKVSKKGSRKRLVLILDAEAGKITWDKARPHKCIYIDDIKEIRSAEDIRQYRLDCGVPEAEERRFFSILYTVPDTTRTKLMHLIADTDENFCDWITTLNAIYKHRQGSLESLMAFDERAIRAYWDREMVKQITDRLTGPATVEGGFIDFTGIERVCRNLHIHVPQETLRSKFSEADVFHTGRLNFLGFQEFLRLMRQREDVVALYRTIARNCQLGITRQEFFDFLRNTQDENVDEEEAKWDEVFARYSSLAKPKEVLLSIESDVDAGTAGSTPRMSAAGLARFLMSAYNVAVPREPRECKFDRPMNEYFISSSHNTYLTGRQLAGTSSVEGYISALTRSCRCVEIDCWDGPEGQPIVVHGKTWTSSISFREVVNAINKYAFEKSPYPLWISLEVHCNPEQQRIMAKIMYEVFGPKLVTEPLASATDRLPSPSELRGRILVKTKKTQQAVPFAQLAALEAASAGSEVRGRRRGNSLPTPFKPVVAVDGASPVSHSVQTSPAPSPRRMSPVSHKPSTITEGEVTSTSDCESGSEKASKFKQSKIVPELGCLAVYCVGVHKTTPFEDAECKTFNHILSWDESVYEKQMRTRESRRAVQWHNMRYLMRVYPKAFRVSSSNFSPLAHWRRGVQMAALNWQTYDLGMQLNTAMFMGGTDQSGYVLKPAEFREFQVVPNLPGESRPRELKRERKNVSFSISVVSAQQLMRPVTFPERRTLDPYVEVEVFLADDKRDTEEAGGERSSKYASTPLVGRTRVVAENGFNPVFDHKFNFCFTTKFPDLVFVRLSVKLAEGGRPTSGSATASFTAKLSSLRQGYRPIPLVDINGDQYMFSTLLCDIRKEPVTSVFVPEAPESTTKFKSIRTVFNRANSPKSSLDSGLS